MTGEQRGGGRISHGPRDGSRCTMAKQFPVQKSDDEWRKALTKEEFDVLRKKV